MPLQPDPASGSDFDPGRGYVPPKPGPDVRVRLNLIRRPKTWGLWWSFHDADGWLDGGCVSSHRTKKAAQAKARIVADWLEARWRSAIAQNTPLPDHYRGIQHD